MFLKNIKNLQKVLPVGSKIKTINYFFKNEVFTIIGYNDKIQYRSDSLSITYQSHLTDMNLLYVHVKKVFARKPKLI